jgi:hypothetical protein
MSLENITHIKVFPGIGTARVGNSPEYFIGPEFPGNVPNLGKNYKDENGYLKPQAARFRVYGYDANDNVVAEITHDPENGISLEWDVHMRNLKAANYAFQGKFGFNPDQYRNPGVSPNESGTDPNSRTSLIIDPGVKTISGINKNTGNAVPLDGGVIFSGVGTAEIPTSLYKKGVPGMTEATYTEKEVSLGRLETDEAGRLIVVGGKGEAGCLIEPPIILQKGVAQFVEGTNVQLGAAQVSTSSTSLPNIFYKRTVNIDLLDQVEVLLASKNDGTGDVFVDDQCILKVNDTVVYTHDFSNGNSGVITALKPINITNAIKPYLGTNVNITIEYVDLHGGKKGGSAFWLCYINDDPTSNGNSYFNNPGWYDDTSGGSINANVTISIGGDTPLEKELSTNNEPTKRGWVAVSPPKYVPSMNNVVSLLDLQLDMFPEEDPVSGTVNFALIDSNGLPNFSSGSSPITFNPLSGVTATGKGNPSLASYNGDDYLAYTDSSGGFLIAVSTDNGATWEESKINAVTSSGDPFTKTTNYAPSLCVFDGALTYVVVIENEGFGSKEGFLFIGSSTDGDKFTFEEANPGGGLGSIGANSSPNAVAYNGQLYISYVGSDNSIIIAHRYLKPSTTEYFYKFNALTKEVFASSSPVLGVFFGELFCAYTGTDKNSYIGSYNNYAPSPSEPADVTFKFNQVIGAPQTKLSPSIAGSHGKLYYAIIDESSNLQLANSAPGLYDVTFINKGIVNTTSPITIANFSDISFNRDIYPILKTVTDYAWVNEPAFHGHAPGKPGDFLRKGSLPYYSNPSGKNNVYRTAIFNFLRSPEQLTPLVPPPPFAFPMSAVPDGITQRGTLMPHLFGEGGSTSENNFNGTNFPNQWLSLTPNQLWKFQEWVNGNFTANGIGFVTPAPTTFEDISLSDQPKALNFSALEPTVGGGFHPGIELTYYMKEPGFFAGAFRFSDNITHEGNIAKPITPGSVAGYMSIPWQGDFWSCNISWWAAMRPDIVVNMDTSLTPPKLDYESWFRGKAVGIPHNSDAIPNYEGGYEHMVRYWSYFGLVVPTGTTDKGMTVLGETERAPCLDDAAAPCIAVNPQAPIHLGVAQPNSASTGAFPDTFYSNSIDIILPSEGSITLSSLNDGTGDIVVDDKCVIKINGNTVFYKDYSNGNSGTITPTAPVDITAAVKPYTGKIVTITIEYIDLYPNAKRGSNYWLTFA